MVPEAVRDARKNAERNGIKNCSFFAGRAENILGEILRDIDRHKNHEKNKLEIILPGFYGKLSARDLRNAADF